MVLLAASSYGWLFEFIFEGAFVVIFCMHPKSAGLLLGAVASEGLSKKNEFMWVWEGGSAAEAVKLF
jgi:hypothetical protein